MTKKKTTKRALLLSAISLLMCLSMLVGSTFAWFTDSVTSSGNKIQSGKLELDLELLDKATDTWTSLRDNPQPLFNNDKWEPGYTETKVLKVENEGTLALKWVAKFISEFELSILADVIDVYVLPSATEIDYPANRNLDGYTRVGTVAEFVNTIRTTTKGTLAAGEEAYLGIALKMQETAGNKYQELDLGGTFDIQIVATQLTAEEDSFDDQYDADATFPMGTNSSTTVIYNKANDGVDFAAALSVPKDAPEGEYKLEVEKTGIAITNNEGNASIAFDMKLMRTDENGTEEVKDEGIAWPVVLQLPHGFVSVTKVTHNGEEITDYVYDPANHTISFTTTHFSPFAIEYKDYLDSRYELDYTKAENGTYTITKGMFVNKNPADYDKTLAEADSDYIVVDFKKGGNTYYVVSEKATSVFVSADGTAQYVGETATYDATNADFRTNMSGSLWKLFNAGQTGNIAGYAQATVYLLPGTYTENTTINIDQNVDVIGVGDTNAVKVVKGNNSSSSNRHLFNLNGNKATYIQVTLRNMCLDATNKTTNSKDNAAVQVIRRTKAKCYDLNIIKGSGWDAVAFYVNGNNSVTGETAKANPYFYAGDCTLNATAQYNIVTTNGTYKFFHNNVTYNNGTLYTANSGSIKNVSMEANDWIWD